MSQLHNTPQYKKLSILADTDTRPTIEQLLSESPQRSQHMQLTAGPLNIDCSRTHLLEEELKLLGELLVQQSFEKRRAALLNGEVVNLSEQRPAHHTLLRQPDYTLPAEITQVKMAMKRWAKQFRQHAFTGFTGKALTTLVHIGIGGSHLGPQLVTSALKSSAQPVEVRFISNLDPADMDDVLAALSPETTLFTIASKSFSTEETLTNAQACLRWLQAHGCPDSALNKHLSAITSAPDKAQAMGVSPNNILPMWDWVGGRYSLWSAIGLPILVALGEGEFEQLLAGAHAVDQHFESAPLATNVPVLLASISFWYQQFCHAQTHAILPYSQRLSDLVPYLQQLSMESNGKSVDEQGSPISVPSGAIIWGGVGSNGQHAFHQLLHQGTHLIPADFILPLNPRASEQTAQHNMLVAHCKAQMQALVEGEQAVATPPHLLVPGNRPCTLIAFDQLTAHRLGALLAMYEHKVFTEAVLLGINPFDQWGVELGKKLRAAY